MCPTIVLLVLIAITIWFAYTLYNDSTVADVEPFAVRIPRPPAKTTTTKTVAPTLKTTFKAPTTSTPRIVVPPAPPPIKPTTAPPPLRTTVATSTTIAAAGAQEINTGVGDKSMTDLITEYTFQEESIPTDEMIDTQPFLKKAQTGYSMVIKPGIGKNNQPAPNTHLYNDPPDCKKGPGGKCRYILGCATTDTTKKPTSCPPPSTCPKGLVTDPVTKTIVCPTNNNAWRLYKIKDGATRITRDNPVNMTLTAKQKVNPIYGIVINSSTMPQPATMEPYANVPINIALDTNREGMNAAKNDNRLFAKYDTAYNPYGNLKPQQSITEGQYPNFTFKADADTQSKYDLQICTPDGAGTYQCTSFPWVSGDGKPHIVSSTYLRTSADKPVKFMLKSK